MVKSWIAESDARVTLAELQVNVGVAQIYAEFGPAYPLFILSKNDFDGSKVIRKRSPPRKAARGAHQKKVFASVLVYFLLFYFCVHLQSKTKRLKCFTPPLMDV